jgi:hypothetical protein
MTDDLKGLIVTIADLDRGDMVRMLMAASDRCEKAMELARTKQARVRRGSETEMATRQHLDAFSKMERLRRIIFFLRRGIDAKDATAADRELCNELQIRLVQKGQWRQW